MFEEKSDELLGLQVLEESLKLGNPGLMDKILENLDDQQRVMVLEIMQEYGIEATDPVFPLLAATGRIVVLFRQLPEQLSEIFGKGVEDINVAMEAALTRCENFEQTAKRSQKKAFADSLSAVVRQLCQEVADYLEQQLSAVDLRVDGELNQVRSQRGWDFFVVYWKQVTVAIALVAGCTFGGLAVGYLMAKPPAPVDPTGARLLTLEEAKVLEWGMSGEGKQAKELFDLNRATIALCRKQRQQLENKCAVFVFPP